MIFWWGDDLPFINNANQWKFFFKCPEQRLCLKVLKAMRASNILQLLLPYVNIPANQILGLK